MLEQGGLRQRCWRAPTRASTRVIGEGGVKVSGGEKQRLSIARALLRRPHLLVFDEATSSLDSLTEEEISDARSATSPATSDVMTILIAHRLSTVMHADRIYVLERGRIVGVGPPRGAARREGPVLRDVAAAGGRAAARAGARLSGEESEMTVNVTELSRGDILVIDGDPWQVTEVSSQTPSARGASMLVKAKVQEPAHGADAGQDLARRRDRDHGRGRVPHGAVPVPAGRRLRVHGPEELRADRRSTAPASATRPATCSRTSR